MIPPATNTSSLQAERQSGLSEIEAAVIDVFVQTSQLLGLPKSFGEIYGLLYQSPEPLCMEDIRHRLNLSLGSASQGLRQLRAFKAVKTVYRPGERKDYYEAEAEFRRLASGFLREEVFPQLDASVSRLDALEQSLNVQSDGRATVSDFHLQRIDKLRRWHRLSHGLLSKLIALIDF